LVHSVCDHHPNKYLLLSFNELNELKQNNNCNPAIDLILANKQYCNEPEGLLSNILDAMKEADETSTLRFWIARAVESFLRGPTCKQDQIFYLNRGILKHLLHLLIDTKTSTEVSQGHFDLLAELMKFNDEAFKEFESAVAEGDRFDRFMKLASNCLVDSNMFIRCATLTFHKFEKESIQVQNSQLLKYMSDKSIRATLIAKLIELITPETLNQENVSCLNTSLVFMITARRQKNLPFYLSDLSRRQNSDGVPLLQNYQELLEFWLNHYSLSCKEKDCQSLEQGTGIKFDEWTFTVKILLGKTPPDKYDASLSSYLPCKDRHTIGRDKSVSRLT
jgi:Trpc4-associated protein